jgi:hypothetical protein
VQFLALTCAAPVTEPLGIVKNDSAIIEE